MTGAELYKLYKIDGKMRCGSCDNLHAHEVWLAERLPSGEWEYIYSYTKKVTSDEVIVVCYDCIHRIVLTGSGADILSRRSDFFNSLLEKSHIRDSSTRYLAQGIEVK